MNRMALPNFDAPWLGPSLSGSVGSFLDSPQFDEMCSALLPLDGVDEGAGGYDGTAQEPDPPAAVPPVPLAPPPSAPLPLRGAALFRCLDPTHADTCRFCLPPPAEGDEGSYELRGEAGRKNGEKRLRSLVARTKEWGSLDERAAAASVAAASPGFGRLASALRARHASELRKVDLLFLARLWGYRSDTWGRRKDRAPRGHAPAGGGAAAAAAAGQPRLVAPPPPPLPIDERALARSGAAPPAAAASCGAQQPPAGGWLDRFASQPPEAVLAAVHAVVGTQLRALAERSVASFRASADAKAHLAAELADSAFGAHDPPLLMTSSSGPAGLPPALVRSVRGYLSAQSAPVSYAASTLGSLANAARATHSDLQSSMLSMPAEAAAQPAFKVLGCKEQPWDALFKSMGDMADFAVNCKKTTGAAAQLAVGVGTPSGGSAESVDGGSASASASGTLSEADAALAARWAALASSQAGASAIEAGGLLVSEVVVRINAMLSQLKLTPFSVYTAAVSMSLGLAIGHLSAVHQVMQAGMMSIEEARALVVEKV